jgi:hypothetical protein
MRSQHAYVRLRITPRRREGVPHSSKGWRGRTSLLEGMEEPARLRAALAHTTPARGRASLLERVEGQASLLEGMEDGDD